jgi:hypothetical protein
VRRVILPLADQANEDPEILRILLPVLGKTRPQNGGSALWAEPSISDPLQDRANVGVIVHNRLHRYFDLLGCAELLPPLSRKRQFRRSVDDVTEAE